MTDVFQVAVIGSINRDDVAGRGVRSRRGWGGILFNVAALLRHGNRHLDICPITFLGTDARGPVGSWLARQPRVQTHAVIPLDRRGNLCRLRYRGPEHRNERLLFRVPPLTWSRLRPALESDLVLVNFISGRDVSIRALERFRCAYRGTVYIDVHSLLLGRRRDGTRYARRPAHWKRVVDCGDIIQFNEREFEILSRADPSIEAIGEWARLVLTPGRCRCLIVTRGARGSVCFVRHGRTWRHREFDPPARRPIADPTGAGDTFSGAWIARWVSSRDPYDATRFATRAAATPARPSI